MVHFAADQWRVSLNLNTVISAVRDYRPLLTERVQLNTASVLTPLAQRRETLRFPPLIFYRAAETYLNLVDCWHLQASTPQFL